MGRLTSTTEPTVALERPGTTHATAHDTAHDVAAFVAAVRAHLTDLPVEEQQELTEGLAADLTEQVADGGADALGDPAAYAAELRLAAGFPAVARRRRFERGVDGLLDDAGAWWRGRLEKVPGDVGGLLTALRPAWWVLRGWAAFALFLVVIGRERDIAMVPTPGASWVLGSVGLLLAVVGSVQVGREKLWPGRRGRTSTRVVLLALNVLAVVVAPVVVGSSTVTWSRADQIYGDSSAAPDPGLLLAGNAVTNIYPYDAQGRPLVGVQLVDQDGRRLTVEDYEGTLVPWTNGRQEMYSVFPMPSREVDLDTGEPTGTPEIRAPFASLPPVTIEGFVASIVKAPKAEGETGAQAAR